MFYNQFAWRGLSYAAPLFKTLNSTKMNNIQKQEIIALINQEKERLGSYRGVANKAGISDATISQMVNQKWEEISDNMWLKVATAVGWKPQGWMLTEITNTKILYSVFRDAKTKSAFFAVSHRAGSGKTASAKSFAETEYRSGVYFLQCREWGRNGFLQNLCQELGIDSGRGYQSADDLLLKVIRFFHDRVAMEPLLIIDEADKLRPAALRALIPMYNQLEGQIGLVILGTDNLEKEIKRGVKYNIKGMDEVDSRFGRNFIHLLGASKKDVERICAANGLEEKALAAKLFAECEPRQVAHEGQYVMMIEDLRRLKRCIEREQLRAQEAA